MAVITSFAKGDPANLKRHRTTVDARYFIFGEGPDGPLFQINTYGSKDRETAGVSQTIQLDRNSAARLWRLLGETYGFK